MDHYTLRTKYVEETRRFLEDVAGLRVGPRPAFQFPGYWLYAGDTPLVHLAVQDNDDPELRRYLGDRATGTGTGALDHVAFRCADLPAFESRLKRIGGKGDLLRGGMQRGGARRRAGPVERLSEP